MKHLIFAMLILGSMSGLARADQSQDQKPADQMTEAEKESYYTAEFKAARQNARRAPSDEAAAQAEADQKHERHMRLLNHFDHGDRR